jgi:chloride channel protein, CIC family
VGAAALILYVFRQAKGSGVNHTKAALYISDGLVPMSTVVGKFIACSLAIGTGNSLGPEDPALQMGSGTASLFGRLFRLTRESMRTIAPVGAAAGIAAAFNTPITAVLFVMEEVIGSWNAAVLGSIVLSAVSAVVVTRWYLGDHPLFHVPQFTLTHPSELIVYAAVGAMAGVLGAAFVRAAGGLKAALEGGPEWTRLGAPLGAGLLVGFAGLWLPQVMGAGYESVDSAMHNRFGWQLLMLLALVKILVTLFCFSAGTPGGMFAPTVFIGAMIGGGIGSLAQQYWPFPVSAPSAYVLVGIGTFFAAVFRAPMTSVFMVFEVSASYVIIVPVMVANIIAYLVSRGMEPVPFFDMMAHYEGLDLPSLEHEREQRTLRVEDAMEPPPWPLLTMESTVPAALKQLEQGTKSGLLVIEGPGEWGWLDVAKLRSMTLPDDSHGRPLKATFQPKPLPTLYPDLSLDAALRSFGPYPVLPVVSRANAEVLVGLLSLKAVHRIYGIGPLAETASK